MHLTYSRPLWRMAERIWDVYQQMAPARWGPRLPEQGWQECQLLQRQIERADRFQYHGAAVELRTELTHELRYLSRQCEEELRRCQQWKPTPLPSIRLLYEELLALDQEFESVNCDPIALTVSVQTEPIVLEEAYLGPFEIVLSVQRLKAGFSYDVNALDPHPAASCEHTTHPHVHARRLCAGEGSDSLETALAQGRLSEFFLVVRQILRNYNPDSAHVSLDDWSGVGCSECGYISRGDDGYSCEGCYSSLCSECGSRCEFCSDIRCRECLDSCDICEMNACPGCLRKCDRCGNDVCLECVNPDSICNTCLENDVGDDEPAETESEEKADWAIVPGAESEPAIAAGVDVHADGLGQAAVPA